LQAAVVRAFIQKAFKLKHQFSLDLIQHSTNGTIVDQRASDGYINATALCKAGGARWNDYYTNTTAKKFLAALEAKTGIPVLELIQKVTIAGVTSTWVHPKVAINLGQWVSADFAVLVTEWVTDWMSSGRKPAFNNALPPHLHRYLANDSKVPAGYFSILQETALGLTGPLHIQGFDIPRGWVPDISVGKVYCAYLRQKYGMDTDTLLTYLHDYMDGRPVVPANLYPDELLPDYRRWFREIWLPEYGIKYFRRKDPASLVYLDRIPALSSPSSNSQPSKPAK